MRLPLYVYSTKNLVGSGLALVSLGLYFSGIIQDFWWEITAGVYGIGALLSPRTSHMDVNMQQDMRDDDILAGLTSITEKVPKLLPTAIAQDVLAICSTLTALLSMMEQAKIGGETAYDVRTSATEYLPETINAYLQLPKAFRSIARSSDGQNADQMLAEQLLILQTQLDAITQDVASADTRRLAENGRFLRERFTQPSPLTKL